MKWRVLDVAGVVAIVAAVVLVVLAMTVQPRSSDLIGGDGSSILSTPTPTATVAPTTAATPTTQPTTEASPQPAPETDRGAVAIQVVNGGAISGSAATVSDALRSAGFSPRDPGNASVPVDRTLVLYAPGQRDVALAAGEVVGVDDGAVVEGTEQDPNWSGAADGLQVLVVVGPALP